jgi:hypothetical protein
LCRLYWLKKFLTRRRKTDLSSNETKLPSEKKLRQHLIRQLNQSLRVLEKQLAGIDETKWAVKPANGGWSIAEIVHHVILVEVQRLQELKDLLAGRKHGATPGATERPDIASIRRRERLVKTRPEFEPTSGIPPKVLMKALLRARKETLVFVDSVDLVKLAKIWLNTKSLGALNGTEFLDFLAAHTERHAAQIAAAKLV